MPLIVRTQRPPSHIRDYRQFKLYLRTDFDYRCAYCHQPEDLNRTEHDFGVEHFRPKSKFPKQICRYSNLLYACNRCNNLKGEHWPNAADLRKGRRFLNPCRDLFSEHLHVTKSGRVEPLSAAGEYFCRRLRLNRDKLIAWRADKHRLRSYIETLEHALQDQDIPWGQPQRNRMQQILDGFRTDLSQAYGDWWN